MEVKPPIGALCILAICIFICGISIGLNNKSDKQEVKYIVIKENQIIEGTK